MNSIFILERNLRVDSLGVVSFGVNSSQIGMQRGGRDDFFRVKDCGYSQVCRPS